MELLVLQLERQAGSRPGEVSSQVWKPGSGFAATSLQFNCLKEEFYFLINKQFFCRKEKVNYAGNFQLATIIGLLLTECGT